jgi:Ca-activated chloride channel family protein
MRAVLVGASLCLSLVVAAHPQVPAQQPQTFAAGTATVVVDVMVTRGGKPVTDLTVQDFEVRDSGTAQQIQFVGVEQVPVALLLALDTSASVRGPALDQLKEAAKAAVASLRPGDQAALMTFSQQVALPAGWTNDKGRLQAAIDKTTAQGSTSLTDAALAALLMRPASAARTLVLLFTDGEDSSSWLNAAAVVDASRRTDSVVYGVTLSPPAAGAAVVAPGRPTAFLPTLAQETGGESFTLADTKDLSAAFVDVLTRFNQRYVLLYESPHAAGSGWHPVEVRVKGPGLRVNARRGYTR